MLTNCIRTVSIKAQINSPKIEHPWHFDGGRGIQNEQHHKIELDKPNHATLYNKITTFCNSDAITFNYHIKFSQPVMPCHTHLAISQSVINRSHELI